MSLLLALQTGGPVTANLTATLPVPTLSSTATLAIQANLTATLPVPTLSSTAVLAIQADLTATLPRPTLDSTATVSGVVVTTPLTDGGHGRKQKRDKYTDYSGYTPEQLGIPFSLKEQKEDDEVSTEQKHEVSVTTAEIVEFTSLVRVTETDKVQEQQDEEALMILLAYYRLAA